MAGFPFGAMRMKRQQQISVFTDNRPGTMARITDALAKGGVNITALAAWGEVDHGVFRMLVDDPLKAAHILGEHGMLCSEATVLWLTLPNRPGVLNEIARILGRAKVNVDYCYGADTEESGAIVVKVDDLKQAEAALKKSPLLAKQKPAKAAGTGKVAKASTTGKPKAAPGARSS